MISSATLEKFNIPALYDFQERAITPLMHGRDVFVVVPTGAGKSACYQLPAADLPGTALVFSPLLSLMTDQVNKLTQLGVPAARIGSDLSEEENTRVLRRMKSWKLLYVAPERLKSRDFMERVAGLKISLVALDEAHVLTQWAAFRPAYALLQEFVRKHPAPTIALTATADDEVEGNVARAFGWGEEGSYVRVVAPPVRENLTFHVEHSLKVRDVGECLQSIQRGWGGVFDGGSQIVYCATRRSVEDVSECLRAEGFNCRPYHGGLDGRTRREVQDLFMSGAVPCIVATNAFGMGIDRPNVRIVLHFDVPGSVFEYVQEVGRGGRDGQPSAGVLNISDKGVSSRSWLIKASHPPYSLYEALWETILGMTREKKRWAVSELDLAQVLHLGRENQSWLMAALRVLELNGGVSVSPGLTRYSLDVVSRQALAPFLSRSNVELHKGTGRVGVYVSAADDDPVDEMVKAGAVRYRAPIQELSITRKLRELPVTQAYLLERHKRDVARLQGVLDFAKADDKGAFIESLFLGA